MAAGRLEFHIRLDFVYREMIPNYGTAFYYRKPAGKSLKSSQNLTGGHVRTSGNAF